MKSKCLRQSPPNKGGGFGRGSLIPVYTITSELHDHEAVEQATREFLSTLDADLELRGDDFSDYGQSPLSLIYVRTGGTEGIFRRLLPQLLRQSHAPFRLLTSGKSNSLAASMEILSYLQQQGLEGEILHGEADYVSDRIRLLGRVAEARESMRGNRMGVVGRPSDWLISSDADSQKVLDRLGIELIDIPMQELLDILRETPLEEPQLQAPTEAIRCSLPGAQQIYRALHALVERHNLQGFTLRCFDLLSAVHNTGCLALARLNAEGIVAGCEGDVPAMLSMRIVQALTGHTGFQANPARINPATGEILMAHCTIPFDLVERYELDTHFESGIGVGIRGYMAEGPVTLFKVSGDLSRHFVAEGTLLRNQAQPNLCRTQQVIQLSCPSDARYFLTRPIGNHHIVLPGHHRDSLEAFWGETNIC